MQGSGPCLNWEIWQLIPPLIEQRPIWLVPRAGFSLRRPLAIGFLFGALAGGKVRKVRKGGAINAGRGFAVRKVWVRFFPASPNSALDGFHSSPMTMLTQILVASQAPSSASVTVFSSIQSRAISFPIR